MEKQVFLKVEKKGNGLFFQNLIDGELNNECIESNIKAFEKGKNVDECRYNITLEDIDNLKLRAIADITCQTIMKICNSMDGDFIKGAEITIKKIY